MNININVFKSKNGWGVDIYENKSIKFSNKFSTSIECMAYAISISIKEKYDTRANNSDVVREDDNIMNEIKDAIRLGCTNGELIYKHIHKSGEYTKAHIYEAILLGDGIHWKHIKIHKNSRFYSLIGGAVND